MAKILSGKEAAADVRRRLQVEVASYGPKFKPGLTIVQVIVMVIYSKAENILPGWMTTTNK